MRSIARKNILGIKPYIPGKPIEEVKRELGLKEVVKLASNECPFGPSPKVLKAINKEARNLNRYPDGGCFLLRQALAKRLNVAGDQLIFGNGSDEIILMATRVFLSESDEVVIARPSFLIYEIAARIAGAEVKAVPLKNFKYDLEGMLQAISAKTKIIFVGNPDNPASTYITQRDLVQFLKKVPRRILVFLDEAYYEFVKESDYPQSLLLLKSYKNVIVTRTFSKMYGLAGLRIGYGIGDPSLIDILNRVREPFNINSIAQVAALECLKDDGYYKKITELVETEKAILYEQFRRLGLSYVQSATNFILVNVKQNSRQLTEKLLRKGVIVRDMDFWGLHNFIRVTIGAHKENQKFLKALKEVL